jgi:hypothetical protein
MTDAATTIHKRVESLAQSKCVFAVLFARESLIVSTTKELGGNKLIDDLDPAHAKRSHLPSYAQPFYTIRNNPHQLRNELK